MPVTAGYRAQRQRKIRRHFGFLPPSLQADRLLPLRTGRGAASRIISPLIREQGPSNELAPAAARTGRGDEPAAGA